MHDRNVISPDANAKTENARVRVSGYLIFLTIAGASIGRKIAQVEPFAPLKATSRRMAESQTLDQMIPYVMIGAICGLLIGLVAEYWLPKWKPAYWLYGTIAMAVIWGTIGMPPVRMP